MMGTVRINGQIGAATVDDVRRQLEAIPSVEPVFCALDSHGGEMRAAIDVADLLVSRGATMLIRTAHSAAAFIACHGKRVGIHRGGQLSVHRPYYPSGACPDANQRNGLWVFADVLSMRTGFEHQWCAAWLTLERTFDAERAVAARLADFIL